MQAQQKISVVKADTVRDRLPRETPDREFWIEQRHALLMQIASIERRLGIVTQRCRICKSRVELDSERQ